MSGAFGLTPGELLAVDVPAGPVWVDIVRRCWAEDVAFLPLDVRWKDAERRLVLDRAQPAAVLDAMGEVTVFGGSSPVPPDITLVIATSGTGGMPRLAELPRAAVEAAVRGSAAALAGTAAGPAGAGSDEPVPSDVHASWICCLTPAHVGGMLVLLRGEILGVPVDVHPGFDADRVAGQGRGAIVSVVPAMVSRLLALDRTLPMTLLVGGDTLDRSVAERARGRGARLVSTYGMTETTGGIAYDGKAFAGTSIRLDADGGVEVRGPTLMEGYRGDPGATASAFDVQGWLRTGDLGEIVDDGRLRVFGRNDDVIRTGGEKVWPHEVERVLALHPAVADVAIAGVLDPNWGQRVVAYVVPSTKDEPPSLAELKAWVRDRLAPFKAPREVELVEQIPRTASGKVRRGALSVRPSPWG
jgi:O-succinylbenzoic acid--CoA ligase